MPPHNFLQHWTTCAKQAVSAVWLSTVKRDVIVTVKYWGGVEVYPRSNVYRRSSQSIQRCGTVPDRSRSKMGSYLMVKIARNRWDRFGNAQSIGEASATQILSQNSKSTPKTGKRWLFDEEKRLVREKGFWSGSKRNTTKFVSTGITEQLWWSTLWCSCNQLTLAVGFQIPGLWRDAKT